jgi:type I restriction enzyme S subunit
VLRNAAKEAMETTAKNSVFPFGYTPTAREMDSRYAGSYVTRRADELYDVASGNGEPSASEGGGVLFFKVNDFNLNADELFLEKGGTLFDPKSNNKIRVFPPRTVVFPKRGASIFLNKVGITRRPVALDPNLMGLVPKEAVIRSEYLYWLIKLTEIGRIADTTSLPQLNHKHLLPLVFPVPNLKIQDEYLTRLQALRTAESVCQAHAVSFRSLNQGFLSGIIAP